jgi:hypothetical protein
MARSMAFTHSCVEYTAVSSCPCARASVRPDESLGAIARAPSVNAHCLACAYPEYRRYIHSPFTGGCPFAGGGTGAYRSNNSTVFGTVILRTG